MKAKHMFDVLIHWVDGEKTLKSVIATNPAQAKMKVVSDSGKKGFYDNEKSKARLVRSNV